MTSKNRAVKRAYKAGKYRDKLGREWRRGLDGWFHDMDNGIQLIYHFMFVEMVEKENPEKPEPVEEFTDEQVAEILTAMSRADEASDD